MPLARDFEAVCEDCLDPLTPGEAYWFGNRCTVCQELWTERVEEWRRGAPDHILEQAFADSNRSVH